jgi:hypothetical protein
MAEPADGAALLVGAEHALAKASLVQALAHHGGDVLAPRRQRRRVVDLPDGWRADLIVHRHEEAQRVGMFLHDEDGPRRFIEAGDDAVQVDQRRLPLHGQAQADVVSMAGIGAAIVIAQEAAGDEAVVVWPLPMLDRRCRRDGERHLRQDGGLEDALRADQGNADALEVEPPLEEGARDGGVTEPLAQVAQELERAQADRGVAVVGHRWSR